jgi:hypothetical protein
VCGQLEQIISDLKIPLLSGGSTEDYLCAIGRGLIQFVCVRESRELYRSLTADRILIHPGSVMFRRTAGMPEPEYIVAGEIVRTTRMYAMSVSPLSRSSLEKISPELFRALGGSSWEPGNKVFEEPKLKKRRDFTNNVKIGNEIFEIEIVKGKKEVKLPWERLKLEKDHIQKETVSYYKGLRGTIIIGGKYTLLKGEKLSLILTLLPGLEIEKALERKFAPGARFHSRENLDKLLEQLPHNVTPAK